MRVDREMFASFSRTDHKLIGRSIQVLKQHIHAMILIQKRVCPLAGKFA